MEVLTLRELVELRGKVILHLAIFSGLRPGEILALQRCNVAADGSSVGIEQRVIGATLMRFRRGLPPCLPSGWRLR
jgi:hypothetical protein